ncbi:hypothetical protein HanXRQr2_Chr15g0675931 [Helianthus annuus]|uniref:Uncharacterized protein n=1 Tax=Helianthus annuus TaxID=4232 RepID=A0A251S587_HELAN|nr:hypothetical protein HanXRQr2_Chr15g0675931 [Helianthus annuus]
MVRHLLLIFGTENDRLNCSFYFKIGKIAGMRIWRVYMMILKSAHQHRDPIMQL